MPVIPSVPASPRVGDHEGDGLNRQAEKAETGAVGLGMGGLEGSTVERQACDSYSNQQGYEQSKDRLAV